MSAAISDQTAATIVGVLRLRAPSFLADLEAHRGAAVVDPLREAAARHAAGQPDPPTLDVGWLTVEQAAVALRVDARSVRRWCARGLLSATQKAPGGAWRVDPADVARNVQVGR